MEVEESVKTKGSYLQLGKFLGFVSGVLGVHEFREQELFKFDASEKNCWRRQSRSEPGDVVARRHTDFVP